MNFKSSLFFTALGYVWSSKRCMYVKLRRTYHQCTYLHTHTDRHRCIGQYHQRSSLGCSKCRRSHLCWFRNWLLNYRYKEMHQPQRKILRKHKVLAEHEMLAKRARGFSLPGCRAHCP